MAPRVAHGGGLSDRGLGRGVDDVSSGRTLVLDFIGLGALAVIAVSRNRGNG